MMEKRRIQVNAENVVARKKKSALPPGSSELASEVEKVLEHVSSPFRWELLDIPHLKPDAEKHDNHTIQKTRKRK